MIKLIFLFLLAVAFSGDAFAVTYVYRPAVLAYSPSMCGAVPCTSVAEACAESARIKSTTGDNARTVTCASANEKEAFSYKLACTKIGTGSCLTYDGAMYTGVVGASCPATWIRNPARSTTQRDAVDWCMKEGVDPPPCSQGAAYDADITVGYAYSKALGSAEAGPSFSPFGEDLCVAACQVNVGGVKECYHEQTPSANGYYKLMCTYGVIQTGNTCMGTEESPPIEPSTPNENKDGKCPFNSIPTGTDQYGLTICTGTTKPPTPPTTTTEKPEVTTPNPDGGSTTTKEKTTTNSDGSVTTTTTTTVTSADGTKATTVDMQTGPRPTGQPGTEDKPEDKSDLCKQNPNLNICKNSQVLGQCGQIACVGDAIQCATLRAAAAMECKQRQDAEEVAASPSAALGKAIAAGNDPMASEIAAALAGTSVDLSSPNLDQGGFIGGGSCFPTKTIHFGSYAVPVDLTDVCESIQPLRYAILAGSFIMAYLIVSRSILSA